MSMFGSTYRCEQLFSLMKGNKSPIRSRITDVHLGYNRPDETGNSMTFLDWTTNPELDQALVTVVHSDD
ncbi:GTF2IRD2B [Cordylochernes scorpioides]|uniref:GTF2IRD2B n=1 Tax=Cordylochernes scorpioides TaxID=51811 RepID=A0ABY6JYX4_9ARAC|nr:GTF2IRD2B [Cordylochernes scorpioides]